MKLVAAPSKESEVVDLYKVIWNDLLAFINCYRHKLDTNNLRKAALGFFTPNEISEGKSLLVNEFDVCLPGEIGQFRAKRRNTPERQAHEAELDDILGLFDVIVSKRLACLLSLTLHVCRRSFWMKAVLAALTFGRLIRCWRNLSRKYLRRLKLWFRPVHSEVTCQ